MLQKLAVSLLLALTLALAPSSAEGARRRVAVRTPQLAPLPVAAIDAIVDEAIAAGVPAISIAVSRGPVLHARAFGFTIVSSRIPATTDSIFQIASLSKQITAAAILTLEEEGALAVSDPLSRWIPELDLGARSVTLEQLLTHTSGLRAGAETAVDLFAPVAQAEMIELVELRGFVTEPGERYEYNNAGYYLLGVVIERASGMSYAAYLEQEFFVPLGLTRTAYCGTGPAVPVPRGYVNLFGLTVPIAPVDMSVAFAAGAICSTPSDLVRWTSALAAGEVVNSASWARMVSPARLASGETIAYGYGLGIGSIAGRPSLDHEGAISGFQSSFVHVPSENLTVVVLTNLLSTERSWARDLAREITRAVLDP